MHVYAKAKAVKRTDTPGYRRISTRMDTECAFVTVSKEYGGSVYLTNRVSDPRPGSHSSGRTVTVRLSLDELRLLVEEARKAGVDI